MPPWTPAPLPSDELERLGRVARLGLHEGQTYPALEDLTRLAAQLLGAPIALVSIVDRDRQRFVARHGLDTASTPRDVSFCAHAILGGRPLEVRDSAQDRRFAGNPLVVGAPRVGAYLGAPIFGGPGTSAVGTLCVLTHEARDWTAAESDQLERLASLAESFLESVAERLAWESSPLSMVILDDAGRCIRANPALEALTGRTQSVLLDAPLASCVLPADRGLLGAMLAHTVHHRQSPTRRELRFVRLTGEVVIGGTSMAPLGEVPGQVVCVIRDVSLERRQDAQSGVVAQVRAELAQPIAAARGALQALEATGLKTPQLPLAEELRGQVELLERLLDARIGDLAARLRIEQALRESEARLRAVVENVLDGLIVIDDRQRIVDVNARALSELEWEYDALVGAPLRAVYPEFTAAECDRWYAACDDWALRDQAARELPEDQATFVTRSGRALRVELRWMRMDWNGPGRLVLIARDVTAARERESRLRQERDDLQASYTRRTAALTEQQRMEVELKTSLAEKETLLKEIHHRVKNNLQIVSSLLTLQLDRMPLGEPRTALLESAQRVRALALVHQHLYGSVSLERIDLTNYVHGLAQTLQAAVAPGTTLQVSHAPVEVTVEQAVPVGLIVNELLTNAFKYGTREGPHGAASVRVGIEESGRQLTVTVRDEGAGLPEGFSLAGSDRLGLQLVRALTRQLKGRLDHRNEQGAVFVLSCPL